MAVVFVGAGLAMSNTIGRPLLEGVASRRWKRMRGQIRGTSARPGEPVYVPDFAGRDEVANRTTPLLRYEYTVNGRCFVGTRVNTVGLASNRAARRAAARYPEGKEVEVWYDPRDPSRAVLEPGITGPSVAWGVLSAIVLAIAVTALVNSL